MEGTFVDVSLIIVLAATLGIIAHRLRQPTIVAYLATGIIVSVFGVFNLDSKNVLDVMATFGITFLLFLVGLEMRIHELKSIGKAIINVGVLHLLTSLVLGFILVRALGMSIWESVFVALALTFSSTIIVVKLLSEKRDLQTLYGRIVVGVLLLQDLIAMIALILLSGIEHPGTSSFSFSSAIVIAAKGIVLFWGTIWVSKKIIPKYIERFAHSQEMLFIVSIAWAFGIALLVASPVIGFSIEIGGFLAGLALAQSAEQFQITARIRPLRDFFIVIFFIMLGSSLVVNDLAHLLLPAIALSLFVILVKPIAMIAIMGFFGYRKRTSFFAGATTAQISEFSLIVLAAAYAMGYVSQQTIALVTLTCVITIIISTYFITKSDALYQIFSKGLTLFERKTRLQEFAPLHEPRGEIILIGAHRMGQYLLKLINSKKVLIVEFDPIIFRALTQKGYKVVFGDVSDHEILASLPFEKATSVISTVPVYDDNIAILKHLEELQLKKPPSVVVNAQNEWEAKRYYAEGASYVLFPHFVGAQHIGSLFSNGKLDDKQAKKNRASDLAMFKT